MPNNNFWIKIISLEDMNLQMPTILGVYNNAVEIQRKVSDNSNQDGFNQLQKYPKLHLLTQKSIKSINQPFQFYGMTEEETLNQYIRRSQSILKHKGRPVTASHYEEIVLEKFPEIFFVKCLQSTSIEKDMIYAPGYLSVIIASKDLLSPLQDSLINEVQLFLKKIINPQINLEVGFPYKEKLKLVLNLQIDEMHAYGDYLGHLRRKINEVFINKTKGYLEQLETVEEYLYISDIYAEILKLKFIKNIKDLFVLKTVAAPNKDFIVKLDSFDDCIMPSFPWSLIVGFVEIAIYTNNDDFVNHFALKNNGAITDATIGVNFLVGPWKNSAKNNDNKVILSKGQAILQSETFTIKQK